MARSDRLLRLLQALRVIPSPVTAARLAEETAVSIRSLYRDIDALRSAGARIEGERGYGYRLVEDYALPPQTFDQDEIEALSLGLAEVRAMGDPSLAQAANSAFAKIAAILPDERERQLIHAISQVNRPDARYAAGIDLGPIRSACWKEDAVLIRYEDAQGVASARTILPLALIYNDHCITILSWCCLREDFRMFRADRVTAANPTGASFRPRRVTLLRQYLAKLRAMRLET